MLLVLSLSACSLMPQKPAPAPVMTQTGETESGSVSGASWDVQEPLVETLSGKVNDYYPIFNGLESKVIEAYHTSGTPTKVYFMNHDADSMMVSLDFLEDRNPNLRLSRVVMPDGTMDGPFGVETGYNITQKGGYELIFNENQMAWDPWSGVVNITITLSGGTYPDRAVIIK